MVDPAPLRMIRWWIVAALLLIQAFSLSAAERVRYTINEQWRYAPGPVQGAEDPDHDDRAWERINLPHTWNAVDAFDETPGYRRGEGWYRKNLSLNPALRGRRLFLYFEGANQVADLYLNGAHAGRHVGGYTAFVFDVTDLVRWDRPNVIAVRVDNGHSQDIPPLNADFTFFGGIYRDVWLLATDPVHIIVTDHASPGVFITTPGVSAKSGRVRVVGSVANRRSGAVRVRVVNRVLDAERREVVSASSQMRIASGGSQQFRHDTPPIARPRLWSPQEPYLYRVRTEVYEENTLTDVVENQLGFRWFRVDPQQGFFLNGKPLRLTGTNRHQDSAGLGNALPDEMHRRDVRLIKETGFNFLRLAHYPQDPVVLEETDRLGLVVWEEIPVVNLISMSPALADNSERMLTEMIRQHFNHPSIVFWGYMNEVLLIKPNPVPDGYYQAVVALTKRLEARVDAEDPTRLTVMALSRDEVPNDHGIGNVPDILGLNLYFGWYYERLESLGPFLDQVHRDRPQKPLMVSEYGAGSDERVHSRTPVAFDFSSEYAQRFHTASLPQLEAHPYLAGTAVWNQFDFGSEFRNDTKHALNQKGLFYYDRTPKDTAFYYRAALLDRPILYIAREWNVRAGSRPEDRAQPIWVYTNLEEVELFVNGRSAESRPIVNRAAEWLVELADGPNEIRARGRRGDDWIEEAVEIRYSDRSVPFQDVAVNAGGAYSYLDGAGVVWEADRPYTAGSWGFVGGEPGRTHHRIYSTPDDPLYQTSREGVEEYRFDVPDGLYEVTLGFAEWQRDRAAGQRVFAVRVNATEVFHRLDLAADYGVHIAIHRTVLVEARGGEGIRVSFAAEAGKPTIAAIQVRRFF